MSHSVSAFRGRRNQNLAPIFAPRKPRPIPGPRRGRVGKLQSPLGNQLDEILTTTRSPEDRVGFHNTIVFRSSVPRLLHVLTKTFAEMGFPGRLIAVEGLDGSGKSTQIYLLKRWLQLQGLKVFFTEWNSSEIVKSATSKGKKMELLTPTTFCLIHATDFADRYERQLVPLLKAGYLVLCDRYVFTAFARDVVRGCPMEWVRGIYNYACLPDITFFFKADLETSLGRILQGRPQLKYFEAGMDMGISNDIQESFRIFQGRMLEQYLAMSTEFNFTIIDANSTIEPQQDVVRTLVTKTIPLEQFQFILK